MIPLHNISNLHEIKAVSKALKALSFEIYVEKHEWESIATYFHMLYSIGFHQGKRQLSHAKPIYQLTVEGELVQKFDSMQEAALVLGVHKSNIGKCIRGKFKCKGFIFSHTPDISSHNTPKKISKQEVRDENKQIVERILKNKKHPDFL